MSARMSHARVLLVASALVPGLLLAGCSGDGSDDDDAGAPGASSSAPASVDPDKVSPSDLPEVPAVRGAKGALDDVEFGDCATDAGEQQVTGTVTNSTRKQRDYAITVSWTNDASDVLARGVAVVDAVAVGASEDFELGADVPDAATTCTFFVQRGTVV